MKEAVALCPESEAITWRDLVASKGSALAGCTISAKFPRWIIYGEIRRVSADWDRDGHQVVSLQIVASGRRASSAQEVGVCNAIIEVSTDCSDLWRDGGDIVISEPERLSIRISRERVLRLSLQ